MAIALQVGWHGPNNSASRSSTRSSPAQSSHCLNGGERKRPWSEDSEEMLQLMMGQFETRKETLDLLGVSSPSFSASSSARLELLDLEPDKPLPCGWEKCLDLKTGAVYYMNTISGAKTLNDPRGSTLPASTTKASSTDLINERPARALFRTNKDPSANQRDGLNLSSLAYNNLFLMQSSTAGTIPQHMATRLHLNSKPKCEEKLCLEGVASDSKPGLDLSEKTAINDATLDSGLELNLNLSTFKSAVIEEKPLNLNDYSMEERRVEQKVSLLFESTSSSRSILSLQTRDAHSVAAAVNGINETESSKVEDNHHYTDKNSSSNNMMVIVGCPRCLMYVMLWKSEPKCPKCGSFVINADSPYLSLP